MKSDVVGPQGLRSGSGVITGADGTQYAGDWKDGLLHGDGVIGNGSNAAGGRHASFNKGKAAAHVKVGGIAERDYPVAANRAAAAAKEAMAAQKAAREVAGDVRRLHVEDETRRDTAIEAANRAANGLSLEELAPSEVDQIKDVACKIG
ncbi:hypothetical protein T484DRAFT_1811894 [Baffinella frigidus]|nr:hypothetical protein T484DRAFT_1811894 [Cryptophyta sp. CCMP2293]